MRFKTITIGLIFIWIIYYLLLGVAVFRTVKQLKIVTLQNYTMRTNGAFGVVKHYYIEPNISSTTSKNQLPIDRNYAGFSLARLMLPKSTINKDKVVTFYALPTPTKILHFAANAGTESAYILRLYLDVMAYLIGKYLFVHLGLIFLWGF